MPAKAGIQHTLHLQRLLDRPLSRAMTVECAAQGSFYYPHT